MAKRNRKPTKADLVFERNQERVSSLAGIALAMTDNADGKWSTYDATHMLVQAIGDVIIHTGLEDGVVSDLVASLVGCLDDEVKNLPPLCQECGHRHPVCDHDHDDEFVAGPLDEAA